MAVAQSLKNLCRNITNRTFTHDLYFGRHYAAPLKRFYKNVYVSEMDGKYEINLDKRKLKTPMGQSLQLPNEALATAVATEWDMQPEKLQIHNMHLTSLCNTTLDNPSRLSKENLVENTMEFLETDTLCYRHTEPPDLVALQRNRWDPVLSWFKNRFDVQIFVCEDVTSLPAPKETMMALKKHLLSFNDWSLTGITYAAVNLKSLILTLAVIDRVLDVESAAELSRLEVIFQIEHWGNVEWSHDLELAQTTSRLAAAVLFIYLNEESTSVVKKTSCSKLVSN